MAKSDTPIPPRNCTHDSTTEHHVGDDQSTGKKIMEERCNDCPMPIRTWEE